jgi:hypothetical protein
VLGFLEASGDVLSINKPPPDAVLSIKSIYHHVEVAWRCGGEELPEGSSRESKLSL